VAQETSIVTTVLAAWGALLSTAIAVWNIYREVTNRGRLRVIVTLADIAAAGVGTIAKNVVWYKVVNVGRQSIWLQQIGGGLRNGQHFLITTAKTLPIKLEPGESFDDYSSDARKVDGDITFLGAWDSVGKIHKLPRRQVKALLKRLRELR
jgi:hypothetical protein